MRLSRLRRGFSLRGTKSDTLVGFGVRFTKHEYDIRSRIAFRDRAPKLEKCKFIFYFYTRLKCYYCLRKLTLCRSEMRYGVVFYPDMLDTGIQLGEPGSGANDIEQETR